MSLELLDLPNEILAHICLSIENPIDYLSYACTCLRLACIGKVVELELKTKVFPKESFLFPTGFSFKYKRIGNALVQYEIHQPSLNKTKFISTQDDLRNGRYLRVVNQTQNLLRNYVHGQLHGLVIEYNNDGRKTSEVQYFQNLKHGVHHVFASNRICTLKRHYHMNLKHGRSEEFYSNGLLRSLKSYHHGSRSGVWIYWYSNMKLHEVLVYAKDTMIERTQWREDGNIYSYITPNVTILWNDRGEIESNLSRDELVSIWKSYFPSLN